MRALVSGSAGFLGRHFRAELQRRGWDVTGCDLEDVRNVLSDYLKMRPVAFPVVIDPRIIISDCLELFRKTANRYDLVVHAAAREPHRAAIDSQPASTVYNRMLDAAMFDWAIRTRQHRVLYLSSCAALDEHPDVYGQAKLAGEAMAGLARQAGIPVTVVRPYSGYGSDQDERFPFGAFLGRALNRDDPFVVWGDGTQVRDWVHVDDVVAACLALVDVAVDGPVSICTGVGTSMLDLASLMCAEVGYRPSFKVLENMPAGVPYRVGDLSSLYRHYTPKIDISEGVRRAVAGD